MITDKNKKFGAEPKVRPPGVVNLIGGTIWGVEILANAIALTYTARALFTLGK